MKNFILFCSLNHRRLRLNCWANLLRLRIYRHIYWWFSDEETTSLECWFNSPFSTLAFLLRSHLKIDSKVPTEKVLLRWFPFFSRERFFLAKLSGDKWRHQTKKFRRQVSHTPTLRIIINRGARPIIPYRLRLSRRSSRNFLRKLISKLTPCRLEIVRK